MGDAPEKSDQESDLGTAVEPGIAREGPRDAAHVERAQEGVGVVVGAHEDGEVPVGATLGVLLRDHRRDLVGLARHGVEAEVLRRLAHPKAAAGPGGDQALVDPLGDLEAVGVVVLDQPVGGVEDGLR